MDVGQVTASSNELEKEGDYLILEVSRVTLKPRFDLTIGKWRERREPQIFFFRVLLHIRFYPIL